MQEIDPTIDPDELAAAQGGVPGAAFAGKPIVSDDQLYMLSSLMWSVHRGRGPGQHHGRAHIVHPGPLHSFLTVMQLLMPHVVLQGIDEAMSFAELMKQASNL